MTQIVFIQPAPEDSVFAPGCFDRQMGEQVEFTVGEDTVMATLVHADVLPSGEGVKLILDIPSDLIWMSMPGSFSVAEGS